MTMKALKRRGTREYQVSLAAPRVTAAVPRTAQAPKSRLTMLAALVQTRVNAPFVSYR